MKILYLVSGIGPPSGWGTEFIQNLIFELTKKGVKATVINPIYIHTNSNWKRWIKEQQKLYNVKIIPLEAPDWVKKRLILHFILTPFYVTSCAVRLMRKQKFDLVHEFTSVPIIVLRSLIFKILFGLPTVITLSVYNKTILGNPYWFRVFNFARFYLIPSKEIIKKLVSIGIDKNKIFYSPPGINLKIFENKINKNAARTKLGLPLSKKIFNYFGSLTREKGVYEIIKAAKLIKKPYHDKLLITLFTIWKGSQEHKKIVRLIENFKLPYLKLVEKYVDTPELLCASDVVILPWQTGHGTTIPPISLIETLAIQKPVIATDILGIKELVNKSNGILIPAKQPLILARSIEKLILNFETIVSQEQTNNRKWLKGFDLNKSVSLHLSVYQAVITP